MKVSRYELDRKEFSMDIKEFIEMLCNLQECSYEEGVRFGMELVDSHRELNRELLVGVVYER